jgi:hypothetical protein
MKEIKSFYKFKLDTLNDVSSFYVYHNHYNWHIFTIACEGLFLNSGLPSAFKRTDDGLYILPDCDVI